MVRSRLSDDMSSHSSSFVDSHRVHPATSHSFKTAGIRFAIPAELASSDLLLEPVGQGVSKADNNRNGFAAEAATA